MDDLIKRLRIKAGVMQMGEKIAWGSDTDLMSTIIDNAIINQDPEISVHMYSADSECDLDDEEQWRKANPALGDPKKGYFRQISDIRRQCREAMTMPSAESRFRWLILNQRISSESLWLAPAIWKENSGPVDTEVFRRGVHLGLDLSQKNDLTCACMAAQDDDGIVHVYPHAFTPLDGIEDRSRRDKTPYDQWARDGVLTAVPGRTLDYEWIAQFLKVHLQDEGIEVLSIEFDRWRISEFRAACERVGFAQMATWHEVGQGYRDMSPRVEAMETALLQNKIRHGGHPVLNLGASSAIAVQDPTGARKLDKSRASNKIDAIIAMLMSVYPMIAQTDEGPSVYSDQSVELFM